MSIFSRIVAGEIPCYKIAEDENYFAFLDINPLQKGHTLVIPKHEVDYIFDLSDEEIAARLKDFTPKLHPDIKRGFVRNFIDNVTQADEGCDMKYMQYVED